MPQALAACACEVDRGGIEEKQIYTRKQIAVYGKEIFFDHILDAARRKGGPVFLVFQLFAQKGHHAIQVMKLQIVNTLDPMIPAPSVAKSVGAGHQQAMKDCKKHGSLHIELELALFQKIADDF